MKELIIKKCTSCDATVKVLKDCTCDNCGINCCGKPMRELKANDSDGAVEKHKPILTTDSEYIIVNVDHVMDEDHYIEWISLVTDDKEECFYLKPGKKATVKFEKVENGKIYSYCNKHGLWVETIK